MGKKIKATFTGQNGSMGFKTGSEYALILSKRDDGSLFTQNVNEDNSCEYESFIAFLNNWDNIKNVQ